MVALYENNRMTDRCWPTKSQRKSKDYLKRSLSDNGELLLFVSEGTNTEEDIKHQSHNNSNIEPVCDNDDVTKLILRTWSVKIADELSDLAKPTTNHLFSRDLQSAVKNAQAKKTDNDSSFEWSHNKNVCTQNEEKYSEYPELTHLLRLHVFPQARDVFLPFTLDSYFHSFAKGQNPEISHPMSHELLRIASLSTFPRDIDISMTRLAGAGFYHTGVSGETKCYSCGVTYSNWKSGDDPNVIHKRISPHCCLYTNDELNNSCTGRDENRTPTCSAQYLCTNASKQTHDNVNTITTKPNTNINVSASELTSTGNAQNTASTTNSTVGHEQTNLTSSCVTGIQTAQTSLNSELHTSASVSNSHTENDLVISNPRSSCEEPAESAYSHEDQHSSNYASLGVNIETPRYPNYAPLQVRISSYQGWPSYLDQTPRLMAMAGFLYAGYSDYTRCFFCGGGLRNWEAGDDPWVEHARWFPECAFLKQNKGDNFIQAVLRKHKETEQKNSEHEYTEQQCTPNGCAANVSERASSLNQHDPLNSVAARSVLEMGYTGDQVMDALRKLKVSGLADISARDIMDVLLQETDDIHTNTIPSVNEETNELKIGTDIANRAENPIDDTEVVLPETNTDTELLLEENRQLRNQRLCKVCLDLDATIAFLPCGHIVCCHECAPAMRKCPLCRVFIKGTVKTYLV